MEAKSAPTYTLASALAPAPVDYDWVYADPDLAPFLRGASRRRPETPLSTWMDA